MENLMTVTEAAKYLGLSRRTIYRLIDRGVFNPGQIGHMLVIEKNEVDAYAADVEGKDKYDPTKYKEGEGNNN
jgi:excisionase family DNA binding protein